jgi:hypothetical protein
LDAFRARAVEGGIAMARRAAVGLGMGCLLAVLLLAGVWVSAPLAGGGMTEIADMQTVCTFSVPGKVGPDNITFDAIDVKVLSFKLVADVVVIDGEEVDLTQYADDFVHAVESRRANFSCVIYVDPKSLPAKADMWVPAEITGDFMMKGFSCDFTFTTVAHLKTDFSAKVFMVTVEDNDKSGVGDEQGTITNIKSDGAFTKMAMQAVAANSGAVCEMYESYATLTSRTVLYLMD